MDQWDITEVESIGDKGTGHIFNTQISDLQNSLLF